ncbi:rod shape-determining protein MreC [Thermobispora bispora]|jgi:rod shape-determining protein MreC|uniref:rod shape-determining protein MreC n=1 Tax=Thermobispora bispora TaxID=2006 RepID=UPI001981810E|nr:rod shape-determining protein MreC [Thermobispora bispora]QSI48880.1 rod shape-determining protein MreC [Thermobispora bispora]
MRETRRARLALGLLIVAALVLITVDRRAGQGHVLGPVRETVAALFGPFERAGAAVARPITEFVGMVRDAPGARQAIADLRKENARLRSELAAQRLDGSRAAKLDRMLGLAGLGRYRVVPAVVIARRSIPGFAETVEIDAGTKDGVRADMTVLSEHGLVGRVVRAGADMSTVALLTDPSVSVGARLEGGNEIGVVSGLGEAGGGDNFVKFRALDSTVSLSAGRRLVSMGSLRSRPYVAGVPIGVIERVENTPGDLVRTAYVRPFTDFSTLDVVGVVVEGPKRDPRDAVLPPEPRRDDAADRRAEARERERRREAAASADDTLADRRGRDGEAGDLGPLGDEESADEDARPAARRGAPSGDRREDGRA